MALTIFNGSMSSGRTTHRARLMPGRVHLWEVSWLPGRRLDRSGAITAMVLADLAGAGNLHTDDHQWIFVEGWVDELGLHASEAVERISQPSAWEGAEELDVPADPEAGS